MDTLGGWLSEIRYFYKRQVSQPLSPCAQALWHYLMWRANGVFWQFPLRLSVPELAGGTRMSVSMVKKARAELIAGGYLVHEAYGGRSPGGYWLMSCVCPGKALAAKGRIKEEKEDGR